VIGIGFAERLAGGHFVQGQRSPDRAFAMDLVAEPAHGHWRATGRVWAESITDGASVRGVITRKGAVLRYELSIDEQPRITIVGYKRLRLTDLYASLSMFRGSLRDGERELARVHARVDLRSEWRACLRSLTLSKVA
jgi:hypothetical protein